MNDEQWGSGRESGSGDGVAHMLMGGTVGWKGLKRLFLRCLVGFPPSVGEQQQMGVFPGVKMFRGTAGGKTLQRGFYTKNF